MASKAELLRLAERVEALEGPDREVDAEIWLTVTPGATRKAFVVPDTPERKGWTIDETRDASHRLIVVPAYTASLDAAMTLVPEGWGHTFVLHPGFPSEAAVREYRLRSDGKYWTSSAMAHSGMVKARTPALALTAACLRALAQEDGR